MNPTLTYFAQQGHMFDPGPQVSLLQNLPTSIADLVKLVQNITIHIFWAERYGFKIPPERMDELQLRSMESQLDATSH